MDFKSSHKPLISLNSTSNNNLDSVEPDNSYRPYQQRNFNGIKKALLNFFTNCIFKFILVFPLILLSSASIFIYISFSAKIPDEIKHKYAVIGIVLLIAFVFSITISLATHSLRKLYKRSHDDRRSNQQSMTFVNENEIFETLLLNRRNRDMQAMINDPNPSSNRIRALQSWRRNFLSRTVGSDAPVNANIDELIDTGATAQHVNVKSAKINAEKVQNPPSYADLYDQRKSGDAKKSSNEKI